MDLLRLSSIFAHNSELDENGSGQELDYEKSYIYSNNLKEIVFYTERNREL